VGKTSKALGLDHMLERKPGALSGGQRQRVALGRAIVRNPKVFLFDEPLSNLDAKMRVQMRSEISRLHAELGSTMIYVTHDQVEAMTMGDRICVMRDGNIMQVADPLTLFRQPENMFVAGFIGSPPMNLIKGKIQKRDGGLFFVENADSNALTLPLRGAVEALGAKYVDKEVVFGIRPEQITNEPRSDIAATPVTLKVEIAEPMGSESLVYLKTGAGSIIARIQGDHIFHLGEDVVAHFDMDRVTLFDSKTENVLR
jgi:multiple sugar transport system ATP-binding protein